VVPDLIEKGEQLLEDGQPMFWVDFDHFSDEYDGFE